MAEWKIIGWQQNVTFQSSEAIAAHPPKLDIIGTLSRRLGKNIKTEEENENLCFPTESFLPDFAFSNCVRGNDGSRFRARHKARSK